MTRLHRPPRAAAAVAGLAALLSLAGCGQTGALYLPDDQSATVITRPAPQASPDPAPAPAPTAAPEATAPEAANPSDQGSAAPAATVPPTRREPAAQKR